MTPDAMSFGAGVEATSLFHGIGLLADMADMMHAPTDPVAAK